MSRRNAGHCEHTNGEACVVRAPSCTHGLLTPPGKKKSLRGRTGVYLTSMTRLFYHGLVDALEQSGC